MNKKLCSADKLLRWSSVFMLLLSLGSSMGEARAESPTVDSKDRRLQSTGGETKKESRDQAPQGNSPAGRSTSILKDMSSRS
jgi:hypothetical protein